MAGKIRNQARWVIGRSSLGWKEGGDLGSPPWMWWLRLGNLVLDVVDVLVPNGEDLGDLVGGVPLLGQVPDHLGLGIQGGEGLLLGVRKVDDDILGVLGLERGEDVDVVGGGGGFDLGHSSILWLDWIELDLFELI